GFLHDLTGRAEDAAAAYRAALYLEPALFQARLLLADCLLRLGAQEEAQHHYREVLKTLEEGRERTLAALADLPLPDRERATRRCRQALGGGEERGREDKPSLSTEPGQVHWEMYRGARLRLQPV